MIKRKQNTVQAKGKAKIRQIQPRHDLFTTTCKTDIGVEAVKELLFHQGRNWRFDYAIPEHRIAIEVEGGVWSRGRHVRPQGFLKDMEKYNTAAMSGWLLLRVTPDELMTNKCFEMIKAAIESRQKCFF